MSSCRATNGKGAKKRRKRRALSWESFESLWKVSNRSPEIAVAIWTTLRQGEQRALHWADVHNVEGSKCTCEEHRDDPHIFVRYGKPPIAGVDCSPKNGETRVVSLFGEALQALRTMPRKGPIVFVSRLGGYRAKGRLIGRKAWKMWKEASSLPDLRWHSLRHTGCTWLVRGELRMGIHAAWPLEAVKEHAGHSELRTTEIYADQREGAQARLMAEQARNKPAATTGGCAANAAIRNDSEESHLRDLNSRPTVYESHRKPSEVLRLAGLAGLARAYALAVARGATDAHVLGLRLAEAVLDLDIRAQEAAS